MEQAGVSRVSHIQFNCSDFRKSVAFYQLLGFKVDRIISDDPSRPPDFNNLDTVPLRTGPQGQCYTLGMGLGDDPKAMTKLELIEWVEPKRTSPTEPPSAVLGIARVAFTVRGLDALIERLRQHNHEIGEVTEFHISPTLKSKYAHVYDPDGCMLTLTEWIKSK